MKKLISLLIVLGLAGSASAMLIKCDISLPNNAATVAGGDWTDFSWPGGGDGEEHDGRSWSIDGVNFFAGNPGGHCNYDYDSGDPDPLTNITYWNTRMLFTISNLEAGDYEVVVVGEDGASGTYTHTSTGPSDVWTVIDATGPGLDNFILTPEPATIALLGIGCLGLLRRRK